MLELLLPAIELFCVSVLQAEEFCGTFKLILGNDIELFVRKPGFPKEKNVFSTVTTPANNWAGIWALPDRLEPQSENV